VPVRGLSVWHDSRFRVGSYRADSWFSGAGSSVVALMPTMVL
jgi:hypothetical protein